MNLPAKSIVLVDDEKSYTELMAQMLSDNLDCPVHAFTHPLKVLDALPAIDVGVVVTDYYMPQLNGIEFIRRAAPLVPHVPFVMITGHNLSSEQDRLATLPSLKGLLAKPFSWRQLADEIIRVWPDANTTPTYLKPETGNRIPETKTSPAQR